MSKVLLLGALCLSACGPASVSSLCASLYKETEAEYGTPDTVVNFPNEGVVVYNYSDKSVFFKIENNACVKSIGIRGRKE